MRREVWQVPGPPGVKGAYAYGYYHCIIAPDTKALNHMPRNTTSKREAGIFKQNIDGVLLDED